MSKPPLQQLADDLVAQSQPGEQLEVYVAQGSSTSVRAYDGEVEAFTVAESRGVGVRVIVDGRQGFAHAGSHDREIIADALAEARDNAAFGEPDEHAGLAEPDGVDAVVHDMWRDEVAAMDPVDKIAMAIELERRVVGADPRISGIRTASYGDSAGEVAIASTAGISIYDRGTAASLGVQALAREGDETQTGYGFDVARAPGDLDLAKAAADAVDRATRMLGATQPQTASVAVVLEPRIAASVLGIVGGMLSGTRVAKGRSPFGERVGEEIASPLLTLVDDPTDPDSFGADSYDGEGLACRRVDLISGGVLDGFLHDSWSARRTGVASTASALRGYRSTPGAGARALAVTPGSGSVEELIAAVDDGVLVQSVSGLHSGVNAVSGDFSVGIEGLRIRDGATAEAVREATLGATVQRLLLQVRAVGGEVERQPGGTAACALVIDDLAMGGS